MRISCSKQPLHLQFAVELLKRDLQSSPAVRLHLVDIDLIVAIPLIQGDRAAQNNSHPVFRLERKLLRITGKHHRLDRAPALF